MLSYSLIPQVLTFEDPSISQHCLRLVAAAFRVHPVESHDAGETMGISSFHKNQDSRIPTTASTEDLLSSIISKLNFVPFNAEAELREFNWVRSEGAYGGLLPAQKEKMIVLEHSLEKFAADVFSFISKQNQSILRLKVLLVFL
jgi:hypothetical protein